MARTVVPTVVTALVFLVGRAAAHDPPDSRFDAPIPLSLLFLGAALVVAFTAVYLAVAGHRPLDPERLVARVDATWFDALGRVARLGFLLAVVAAVITGLTNPSGEVTTAFVWGVWLKGLALVAALVGSPWSTLSPWRTLHRWVGSPTRRRYPAWLGRWPAVFGFLLLVGYVENLTEIPASARATALLVVGYAAVMLAGGSVFGRDWFDHADTFAVLYELFGRVAPVTVTAVGRSYEVSVRWPWRGCSSSVRDVATVAFVVATVYTVSFDGFTDTIQYEYLLGSVYVTFDTARATEVVTYVGGYLLFLGGFLGVVRAGDALGKGRRLRGDLLALAPTVLPIAVAYDIAHTYPLVVRELSMVGAAVVGVAPPDPLAWLSVPVFWGTQVILVTAGHVVAVVAAHHVTGRRYAVPWRGHVPLTVLMVGYTVLSLWIISLPVVR